MGQVTVEATQVSVAARGDSIEVTLTNIVSAGCTDKAIVEALGEDWVASLISTEALIANLASRGDEVSRAAQCVESSATELQQLLASRWID
jgi:hypothetical protein